MKDASATNDAARRAVFIGFLPFKNSVPRMLRWPTTKATRDAGQITAFYSSPQSKCAAKA
jgi:hypothetical protein